MFSRCFKIFLHLLDPPDILPMVPKSEAHKNVVQIPPKGQDHGRKEVLCCVALLCFYRH